MQNTVCVEEVGGYLGGLILMEYVCSGDLFALKFLIILKERKVILVWANQTKNGTIYKFALTLLFWISLKSCLLTIMVLF